MYINKRCELGIGLVEVVAALGISVIVLTALVSLSLFTLRSSLQSKLALEGQKLANRELELVRAYRDAAVSWENDFIQDILICTSSARCHMETSGGISVQSGTSVINSGQADQITTSFFVLHPDGSPLISGDSEVSVTVEVTWSIGGDPKHARLYTDLTNWKQN